MGLETVAKSPRDHKVRRIKGFRDLRGDVTAQIRIQLKLNIKWRIIRLSYEIFQSHLVRVPFIRTKWQIKIKPYWLSATPKLAIKLEMYCLRRPNKSYNELMLLSLYPVLGANRVDIEY